MVVVDVRVRRIGKYDRRIPISSYGCGRENGTDGRTETGNAVTVANESRRPVNDGVRFTDAAGDTTRVYVKQLPVVAGAATDGYENTRLARAGGWSCVCVITRALTIIIIR